MLRAAGPCGLSKAHGAEKPLRQKIIRRLSLHLLHDPRQKVEHRVAVLLVRSGHVGKRLCQENRQIIIGGILGQVVVINIQKAPVDPAGMGQQVMDADLPPRRISGEKATHRIVQRKFSFVPKQPHGGSDKELGHRVAVVAVGAGLETVKPAASFVQPRKVVQIVAGGGKGFTKLCFIHCLPAPRNRHFSAESSGWPAGCWPTRNLPG